MSGFADYEAYDALGLAELVRQGRVSPGELLEAAIERVEARNSKVNAVTMALRGRLIATALLTALAAWPPRRQRRGLTPSRATSR